MDDHNSHRRNLVVTSVAFIAYFWGEGELNQDGAVTLSFLSIKFNYPFALQFLAWVALGWFAYRYWLSNRKDGIWDPVLTTTKGVASANYIAKVLANTEKERKPDLDFRRLQGPLTVAPASIPAFIRGKGEITGKYRHNDQRVEVRSDLAGWPAFKLKAQILIHASLTHQTFWDLVLPWCIFVVAFVLGVSSLATGGEGCAVRGGV